MKFALPMLIVLAVAAPTLAGCGTSPGVAPVARNATRAPAKASTVIRPAATPAPTATAAPQRFLTQLGARAGAFSPSGEQLTFEAADGRIYLASADGSQARAIGEGRAPVWSPAGTAIAFVRGASLVAYTVAAQRADVLFESPEGLRDPAWMPDGRALVFANGGGTALQRLVLGQGASALHRGTGIANPAVAPDGTIVFEADGGLARLTPASPRAAALRVEGTRPRQPAFSPSGRSLAYAADAGVYVAGADGSKSRLMRAAAGLNAPAWHPRVPQLLVSAPRGASSDLTTIELAK